MAVTQNTYTGDGTTVLFSFTFPYLETTDIKVSLNGTVTTAYTLANATTIQFNTAPANGVAIRIYRQTDDASLAAQFYPGSAIRSSDLNDNFTQNLYVTQESSNNAATATSTANTALTNSNTGISTANTALSTANTASSNASAAVSTANTASSNASAAVSTANTASSNATTAVNTANAATATANSAASDAATAISTANSAVSTANTASTAATNAVNTANAASSAASSAVSTANAAASNAATAVSTANTASSNATTAVNTANTAISTANAAASAVANAILYDIVANVAAIPASPANNDAVEVTDSTGIESFTPLTGVPGGFAGNSGLSVRIVYTTTGNTWTWIQYFPNDPETRYLKIGSTGTVTSTMIADGTIVNADVNASAAIAGTKISPDFGAQNRTSTGTSTAASFIPTSSTAPTNGVYLPAANSVAISTGGSGRLFVDASGRVGVGTTPSAKLHVSGTTRIINGDSAGASFLSPSLDLYDSTHAVEVILTPASGLGAIGTYSNHPFAFYTNNAERARIDSSGRLGIGTSSPSTILHVNTNVNNSSDYYLDTGATALIRNDNASGVTSLKISSSGNSTSALVWGGAGSETLIFANRQTERMRIDSSGRVGIGTTSPQQLLHVDSGSGGANAAITLRATGYSGNQFNFYAQVTPEVISVIESTERPIAFKANGSERARIDGSGRLLVGTSTSRIVEDLLGNGPQGLIQIEAANSDAIMSIISAGTADAGRAGTLSLGRHRNSTVGGTPTIVQNGDTLGAVCFAGGDGTDMRTKGASIAAQVDGTPGTDDMPGRLVFSTTADGASSPTERMRITQKGVLKVSNTGSYTSATSTSHEIVNETTNQNVVQYINTSASPYGNFIYFNSAAPDNNSNYFLRCEDNVAVRNIIYSDGDVWTSDAGTLTSDVTLKRNITDATPKLADVMKLKVRNFYWEEDYHPNKQDKKLIGFIAQELEEVFPGLVSEHVISGGRSILDEDGNDTGETTPEIYKKGIKEAKLVPILVKALQEAVTKIESLEARLTALESA